MTYPYLDVETPLLDALIQRAKSAAVQLVMCGGQVIYQNGRFTRVDRDAALGELRRQIPSALSDEEYTERLAEAGIEPSVGSVGDSCDNALAETIDGLHKAEMIHRRGPWRSFETVEFATLTWVDWFNHRRLLEPIGNIPPAEAEECHYAKLHEPAIAA